MLKIAGNPNGRRHRVFGLWRTWKRMPRADRPAVLEALRHLASCPDVGDVVRELPATATQCPCGGQIAETGTFDHPETGRRMAMLDCRGCGTTWVRPCPATH